MDPLQPVGIGNWCSASIFPYFLLFAEHGVPATPTTANWRGWTEAFCLWELEKVRGERSRGVMKQSFRARQTYVLVLPLFLYLDDFGQVTLFL